MMTPLDSLISFIDGPLNGHCYGPRTVESAWKLIELAADKGESFLFAISNCELRPRFLGAHRDRRVALFVSNYDGRNVDVMSDELLPLAESQYVEIIDHRWPLAYYIPDAAFVPLARAFQTFRKMLAEMPLIRSKIDQTFNNPAVVPVCTVDRNS